MSIATKGDVFPNFRFKTYCGEEKSIGEVVKQKKYTVIWVMRFIGCRFCQYDLEQLKEEYGRFINKDTQVYVVLQSSRESINDLKGSLDIPFDVICDTEHHFYKTLSIGTTPTKEDRLPKDPEGLKHLHEKQEAVAKRNYERRTGEGEPQQLPALFILNRDRIIEYAHYAANSIDIPGFDEILEIINHI